MNILDEKTLTILADLSEELGLKMRPDLSEEKPSDVNAQPRQPFFNPGDPSYVLKAEKPVHRQAVLLKAAGYTDREIAAELELHPLTIAYIVKQPWALKLMEARVHGTADKAMARLQEETLAAAERLIEIAKNAENDETRRKANNDILDRKYGKPNQPYSVANKSACELSDGELAKLVTSN